MAEPLGGCWSLETGSRAGRHHGQSRADGTSAQSWLGQRLQAAGEAVRVLAFLRRSGKGEGGGALAEALCFPWRSRLVSAQLPVTRCSSWKGLG